MKITLEINTANIQDVVEAIDTLKPLLPKDMNSLEDNKVELTDNTVKEDVLPKIEGDIVSKSEYDSIKEELEKAKALIEKLTLENENLNKEKEEISEKINALELKESVESISIDDIVYEDSNTNKITEEDLEALRKEYEAKIDSLSKKIEFHEGRSNKNFEEVKRLRTLVDNVSVEKRNLEKKVNLLEKENEDLKELQISDNSDEINKLSSENKSLLEDIEVLKRLNERLDKDVEFQKNRSKTNWEELKTLKAEHENLLKEDEANKKKIEELTEKLNTGGSEGDIEKLKMDFVQAKSDYENTISELRLSNDKLQNEINLYVTKFSDEDIAELQHLKKIKGLICANEKGAAFWNGVESKIH